MFRKGDEEVKDCDISGVDKLLHFSGGLHGGKRVAAMGSRMLSTSSSDGTSSPITNGALVEAIQGAYQ
jgi:hypothetical protein